MIDDATLTAWEAEAKKGSLLLQDRLRLKSAIAEIRRLRERADLYYEELLERIRCAEDPGEYLDDVEKALAHPLVVAARGAAAIRALSGGTP